MEKKKKHVQLRTVKISRDLADKIFEFLEQSKLWHMEEFEELGEYIFGTSPDYRKVVYCQDKDETLILPIGMINYCGWEINGEEDHISGSAWKQVRARIFDRLPDNRLAQEDMTGTVAYHRMKKKLLETYDEESYEEALKEHEAPCTKNTEDAQVHHMVMTPEDTIVEFKNCIYYDINGAHQDAIMEIFPKARETIMQMGRDKALFKSLSKEARAKGDSPMSAYYADQASKIKAMFNYFVGNLVNHKHEGSYFWIVKRTTKKLKEAMTKVCGSDSILLYANTDGFIVSNPNGYLENVSDTVGDFKVEYQGTVRILRSGNYCIMQMGDELKGNMPKILRDKVDLFENKSVTYERHLENHKFVYSNIEEKEFDHVVFEENW